MSPAECNYGIGDKELMAIVTSPENWHMYLHALTKLFTIYTDHYNLQTFGTKALLNQRQARWAGTLSQYYFIIAFRPSIRNGKADALNRKLRHRPKEGEQRA